MHWHPQGQRHRTPIPTHVKRLTLEPSLVTIRSTGIHLHSCKLLLLLVCMVRYRRGVSDLHLFRRHRVLCAPEERRYRVWRETLSLVLSRALRGEDTVGNLRLHHTRLVHWPVVLERITRYQRSFARAWVVSVSRGHRNPTSYTAAGCDRVRRIGSKYGTT